MAKLLDEHGEEAVVGKTVGYWIKDDDVVSTAELEIKNLGNLGFPRDWPNVYTNSKVLKSLVGKRGSVAGKKVGVVAMPTTEEKQQAKGITCHPWQSFMNAEAIEKESGLMVVRGWAILEHLDKPTSSAFVAVRYWWNSFPDGRWVDFTPRPKEWPELLLAEAAHSAPKSKTELTAADLEIMFWPAHSQREAASAPAPAPAAVPTPAPAKAPAAAPAPAAVKSPKQAVAPPPPRKIPPAGSFPVGSPAVGQRAPEVSGKAVPRMAPPPPQQLNAGVAKDAAAKPAKRGIDYSKFDQIEDSDDEREAEEAQNPSVTSMGVNRPTLRIIQTPTEVLTLEEYRNAFRLLLEMADPPTVAPDIERMFKAFKSCPDTTDRALIDQACHAVEGVPLSAMQHGLEGWWKGTAQMTQAMLSRNRYDEARLWCVIRRIRKPEDVEPLHVHAWCLEEQWTQILHSGEAKVRVPTWQGTELVDAEEHAERLQAVLRAHLQKSIDLSKGPPPGASYAGLSASLERSGEIEHARKVGRQGAKLGVWLDEWQRPAHFVRSLQPRQAWHEAASYEVCAALEEAHASIKEEFTRYVAEERKLKDVGIRSGDAMLLTSGSWKEVPLFNAGRMDHEVCSKFPETVRTLTERCADATGLAFCGGGEVAFRILGPGTGLKPHCGPTSARLTCQLGVLVPLGAEPGVTIGTCEPRPWIDGKCICFDDSYEHSEALDEMADGDCIVLTAHFWHPAFQHKNDPDWKMKGSEETGTSQPLMEIESSTPMGSSGVSKPVSDDDLPPID